METTNEATNNKPVNNMAQPTSPAEQANKSNAPNEQKVLENFELFSGVSYIGAL